jgi:hypothetical protein
VSDIKTIHKTTLFSIEKILAKNGIKEVQLSGFDKWTDLRRRLEMIRQTSDYFVALKMADELITDVQKFIKEKRRKFYGDI